MGRSRWDVVLTYFGLRGEVKHPSWASSKLYLACAVFVAIGVALNVVDGMDGWFDWFEIVAGPLLVFVFLSSARDLRRLGR